MKFCIVRALLRSVVLVMAMTAVAVARPDDFPLELRATDIIRGPAATPSAMVQATLSRALVEPAWVEVWHQAERDGTAHTAFRRVEVPHNQSDATLYIPVPLPVDAPVDVLIRVVEPAGSPKASSSESEFTVPVPDPEWQMHFIPGFHYDPVWWNTQAHYTETGKYMEKHVGPGLTLVDEYLRMLETDPEYKVALHQLPYLKTFVESRPDRVAALLAQVDRKCCELVGGTYCELSSTLVNAESTIRNAAFGSIFQRDVLGGTGDVFWQCDVFGHDPMFPSLMARTGHRAGAFARGPFHQWGAARDQVNFPSEFMWMSPDGEQILTHYMTGHYGYAYARFAPGKNTAPDDPARSNAMIAAMFLDLKQPALTHHVMFPMHMDFIRPLENLSDVVRAWNETYLAPKAIIATPEGFFDAVDKEIEERKIVVPVITRDMNPVYTGCPVSFADLKTANREAENELRDAELWATLCMIEELAPYPRLALERAWRQVLFNSHHDGVTGSMSDQVYLDIMAGYRDAIDLARSVKEAAQRRIASSIETRTDVPGRAPGPTYVAFNSVARARSGPIAGERRSGERGETLSTNVPSIGYRLVKAGELLQPSNPSTVVESAHVTLENELLRIVVDPAQGGAIVSLLDKVRGSELLLGPANDVVVHDEYSVLPGHGEGPWHLAPTGNSTEGTGVAATVKAEPGAIIVEAKYPTFTKWQKITLRPGDLYFDCITEIRDWTGSDKLLRVEFPFSVQGAKPIFQTAGAVIGRPFARDVDTQKDSWTLDQACWQWAGLGAVARVRVMFEDKVLRQRSLGVGEIVLPAKPTDEDRRQANRLAAALVKSGVTTTIVKEDDRRYGDLALDSNLPDFRLLLGETPRHQWVTRLEGEFQIAADVNFLEIPGDPVPLLVVAPHEAAIERVEYSLAAGHTIDCQLSHAQGFDLTGWSDRGAAIANKGSVSVNVQPDGTIGLNLMRSCTSWPSGVWIDPPARRLPDGAPLGTMHGSHRFEYRVIPYSGDHRDVGVDRMAFEFQHPVEVRSAPLDVTLASQNRTKAVRFIDISDTAVQLLAVKAADFPVWGWQAGDEADRTFVLRLWNPSGQTLSPRITFHRAIREAFLSDHLESKTQKPIEIDDTSVHVSMGPNAIETLRIRLVEKEQGTRLDEPKPLRNFETGHSPTQYWLENRGEGITGNGVVSIVPSNREVTMVRGRAIIPVTIVSNLREGATDITLDVEHSEELDVTLIPNHFEGLKRGEPGKATLSIRAPKPDRDHRSVVSIKRRLADGRVRETSSVWVSGEGATGSADPAVTIENAASIVLSGGVLRATITNDTDGPITGTARWLGPKMLWDHQHERQWRRDVTIASGGKLEIVSQIGADAPATYAMLQFLCGGQAIYGASIAITSDRERVIAGFPVDRVRLRKGEPSEVTISARSLDGLDGKPAFTLQGHAGWNVEADEVSITRQPSGVVVATQRFAVTPSDDSPVRGVISAIAPDGSVIGAAYSIAPQQSAKRSLDTVTVDANHSEWDPAEFTECRSEHHNRVRCAARYGVSGLALALEVEDDRFVQTNEGASIWEGDSIQFALSVAPSTTSGYGHHDLEFGSALTPSGPVLWCWYAGEGRDTGLIAESEVAVEYRDGKLFYEIMLPRSAVPQLSLEPSAVLGFSYIANDDDGAGYAGATQWSGGMVGGKDASLFGELLLQ